MMNISTMLEAFVCDEDGLSATEYVVMFAAIIAVVVAGAAALSGLIGAAFNDACSALGGSCP